MRKLASVQQISSLSPIPNADRIELARVLGWNVVVRKGEFNVGDKCIYIEIDSKLPPDNHAFDFLKDSKGKLHHIKTAKLRGQISQGICFKLSDLVTNDYPIGYDLTDTLNIKKYEPDMYNMPEYKPKSKGVRKHQGKYWNYVYKYFPNWITKYMYTYTHAKFPDFINKTDETRVQCMQDVLDKYKGTSCYIAEKLDGSSITIWWDNKDNMHVASRNLEVLDHENYFYKTAYEYFHDKTHFPGLCLQGELIGSNIQKNKYGIKGKRIYIFNIYDINKGEYYCGSVMRNYCKLNGIDTVPILDDDYLLSNDIQEIVNMSIGNSAIADTPREGIVIRPNDYIVDYKVSGCVGGRISFKAINPEFLLKWGE